jgi:hypothetical protein
LPFDLTHPPRCKAEVWKVKIREKEASEPPHVTILRRTEAWRLGLRDGRFLVPPGGSWKEIDRGVREGIEAHWESLRNAWDAKYPFNVVGSADADE